jgi:molybdopterin molybdotransferase
MSDETEKSRRGLKVDVRGRGFSDRVSLEVATEWIDAHSAALRAEEIDVREAAWRVLAADAVAAWAIPAADCAGVDGYAVRADDTVGAGDYNPLKLALAKADELPAASAAPIMAGERLPSGADAILPFELTRVNGATGNASLPAAGAEVFGAVAEGFGVERKGQQVQAGTRLFERGRRLLPQDIGLLASLGMERVQVVRRPRVGILVGKPKRCAESGGQGDANSPMLRALVERDGGSVVKVLALESDRRGFAIAYAADLMLVAGRSGTGWDDDAAQSIAEVGELAMHGVALRPGSSAGMGSVGSAPVVLLPGDPLDCLCAYEMLAGRMVRRLGGRAPDLPYAVVEAEVGRKIVSMVGVVDVCRVRLKDGRVEAIGSAESGGLASAVWADGFVVIPAPLEGYPPGARVSVYVYGGGVGGQIG